MGRWLSSWTRSPDRCGGHLTGRSGVDRSLAEAVIERDRYCAWCGLPNDQPALHHRQLRAQGGKDEAENLLALHHACHNIGAQSVHANPKLAVERGFIVPSWAEPKYTTVTLSGGEKVYLSKDDGYVWVEGARPWERQ